MPAGMKKTGEYKTKEAAEKPVAENQEPQSSGSHTRSRWDVLSHEFIRNL
jgi:hypothetical protein